MSDVKIKVRPQQTVNFPARCVHCEQQATAQMPIRQRIGRTTRLVDVPLCADCAAIVQQRTGAEARWQVAGWILTAVIAFLALSVTLVLTPTAMPYALRLLTAVVVAFLLGALLFSLFRFAQQRAATPEKKAIQNAAAITNFSWRTTTFKFANEAFAERFRLLNESLLM